MSDIAGRSFSFNWFTSPVVGTEPGNNESQNQIRWGEMPASTRQSRIKGIVLLLNGRTEFMEKYLIPSRRLAKMGYHVFSMDWRGQGGSLRELPNRHKGYVRDFDHYVQDLDTFFYRFVAPRNLPVTIMAHSMGGHIVLRYLMGKATEDAIPPAINKALLLSPMLDIRTSPFPKPLALFLSDMAVRFGMEKSYALGSPGDYSPNRVRFENNPLTHDRDRFFIEHGAIEKNSHLALGGVTWGWLKQAFDSIEMIQCKKRLAEIPTPILIASAAEDKVVCNRAHQNAAKHLPNGTLITIPGALHEIVFETEAISEQLWRQLPI